MNVLLHLFLQKLLLRPKQNGLWIFLEYSLLSTYETVVAVKTSELFKHMTLYRYNKSTVPKNVCFIWILVYSLITNNILTTFLRMSPPWDRTCYVPPINIHFVLVTSVMSSIRRLKRSPFLTRFVCNQGKSNKNFHYVSYMLWRHPSFVLKLLVAIPKEDVTNS
jgi:hypothetical protein